MPYTIKKTGSKYCVHKKGSDGEAMGKSMGCHDTKAKAVSQIGAIESSEKKEKAVKVDGFLASMRGGLYNLLGIPNTVAGVSNNTGTTLREADAIEVKDRALSISNIWSQASRLLWDEYPDEWPYMSDIFHDEKTNSLYGVVAMGGKLYRCDIAVTDGEVSLSEAVEVEVEHVPVDSDDSDGESATKEDSARASAEGKSRTKPIVPVNRNTSTYIFRQADGRYRRIDIACCSVLNRVGEIDSRKLFDSFITYARENNDYPYYTFYHEGDHLRTGQVDFLMRSGDFYITSGLYDDVKKNRLALVEIKARQNEPDYYGISIGYTPTEEPESLELADGVTVYVYNSGIHRENSTLPEKEAAAWFTMTALGEVTRMKPKAKKALRGLFDHAKMADDPLLDELIEEVDERQREVKDENLLTRDAKLKIKLREKPPKVKPEDDEEAEVEDEVDETDTESDGDSALDTGSTDLESDEEGDETEDEARSADDEESEESSEDGSEDGSLEGVVEIGPEEISAIGEGLIEDDEFVTALADALIRNADSKLSKVIKALARRQRESDEAKSRRLLADLPDEDSRGRVIRPSVIRNGTRKKVTANSNGRHAPVDELDDMLDDDQDDLDRDYGDETYTPEEILANAEAKYNDGFYE